MFDSELKSSGVFARLKAGVSPEQMRDEFQRIGKQLAADQPDMNRERSADVEKLSFEDGITNVLGGALGYEILGVIFFATLGMLLYKVARKK